MAFDAFLKLTGTDGKDVEGESTDAKHAKEIEISSFSFGANNTPTIGSGTTGSSGGKMTASDFCFLKRTDKASTILFTKCADGSHFEKATVTLRKAGGTAGQQEFIHYLFEQVYVSSIQWSGSSGGDDTPTESVSLTYGKFTLGYSPQKADGTLDAEIAAGWDMTKNETYAGELPKAS
jgi:type VI secretion system secreted protein Hcp